MPRIEIDPTLVDDKIEIAMGDFVLTVRNDFMYEDQMNFADLDRDMSNRKAIKEQMILLFDIDGKKFDEIAKKYNFRVLKNFLMEGFAAVSGIIDMEKKTQGPNALKSQSHSQDSSTMTKSGESKAITKKE